MFCRTFHEEVSGYRHQVSGRRIVAWLLFAGVSVSVTLPLRRACRRSSEGFVCCEKLSVNPCSLLPETLLFVVLPEKPVQSYLCAEDGEEEGEESVAEVVAPGGIDDEGAGDGEG